MKKLVSFIHESIETTDEVKSLYKKMNDTVNRHFNKDFIQVMELESDGLNIILDYNDIDGLIGGVEIIVNTEEYIENFFKCCVDNKLINEIPTFNCKELQNEGECHIEFLIIKDGDKYKYKVYNWGYNEFFDESFLNDMLFDAHKDNMSELSDYDIRDIIIYYIGELCNISLSGRDIKHLLPSLKQDKLIK